MDAADQFRMRNKRNAAIKRALKERGNEESLSTIIMEFLGNVCDKCHRLDNDPLHIVLCVNVSKAGYRLRDTEEVQYCLKRMCSRCRFGETTVWKVHVDYLPDTTPASDKKRMLRDPVVDLPLKRRRSKQIF